MTRVNYAPYTLKWLELRLVQLHVVLQGAEFVLPLKFKFRQLGCVLEAFIHLMQLALDHAFVHVKTFRDVHGEFYVQPLIWSDELTDENSTITVNDSIKNIIYHHFFIQAWFIRILQLLEELLVVALATIAFLLQLFDYL